jgi:hypothetical protein
MEFPYNEGSYALVLLLLEPHADAFAASMDTRISFSIEFKPLLPDLSLVDDTILSDGGDGDDGSADDDETDDIIVLVPKK